MAVDVKKAFCFQNGISFNDETFIFDGTDSPETALASTDIAVGSLYLKYGGSGSITVYQKLTLDPVTYQNLMSAVWGGITGTLSSQTDLQDALNAKATDSAVFHKATSGEISVLTEKTTPVNADVILGENSQNSNSKIKIQIGNTPGNKLISDSTINGIVDPSNVTVTFTLGTRTFNVSGTFSYWNQGIRYSKTIPGGSPETVTLPTTTIGTYFIYYVGTTLTCSTVGVTPDFSTSTLLAYVYYNGTAASSPWLGANYVLFNERHTCGMDWETHENNHYGIGTIVKGSGFSLNGTYAVASGTGGLIDTSYGVDSGTIIDEDIDHTISTLTDNAGVGNQYPVLYRIGATEWRWVVNNLPFYFSNNNLNYNQLVTGVYQLTEISQNGRYMNMYLCATNADSTVNNQYRFIWIMGQTLYTSLTTAQAESFLDLNTSGLPIIEIAPLWRITMRYEGTYSTASGKSRIESTTKIVGTKINVTSQYNTQDHNNLANRSAANSHPDTAISSDPSSWTGILSSTSNTDVHTCLTSIDTNLPKIIGNYITNWNFETNSTGWNTYADTAQLTPVDGTGGSPTTTFARNTSSPLFDTGDGLITKDAANRQGEGISYDFTLDTGILTQVVQIEFFYKTSTNYVSNDYGIYIYDKTNSQLIYPNIVNLSASGTSTKFITKFFPNTSSTSYRIIFHTQTTSALAYTINIDNIKIGKEDKVIGIPISDWVDFPSVAAGTLITATTTNPSYGTVVTNKAKWRRVGDSMEIFWQFNETSAGTGGSGYYLFNLPSGYYIDSNKISIGDDSGIAFKYPINGIGSFEMAGYGFASFGVYGYSTTKVYLAGSDQTIANAWGSSYFSFGSATGTVGYSLWFTVPISGWSSNINLINSTTEYAANYQASINTNDTTSFLYNAVDGTSILSNTQQPITTYYIKFNNPIQPNDILSLEFKSKANGKWINIADAPIVTISSIKYVLGGYYSDTSNIIGAGITLIDTYTAQVWFGSLSCIRQGGSSPTWAQFTSASDGFDKWRVRKSSGSEVGELPLQYQYPDIDGLSITNNVSDSNNDIDIGIGKCIDGDYKNFNIVLNTTITKRLDASWAAGTNQGGLDTGSKSSSTTYHIYIISNGSTTDVLFSTSATSPTMPSGYIYKKLIGSIMTDGSSNIYNGYWKRYNNILEFWFKDIQVPIDGIAINSSGALYSLTVPSGIEIKAIGIVNCGLAAATGALSISMNTPNSNYQTPTLTPADGGFRGIVGGYTSTYSTYDSSYFEILTDTSKQIKMKRTGTYSDSSHQTTVQLWGFKQFI